jgi:hypothetical protein
MRHPVRTAALCLLAVAALAATPSGSAFSIEGLQPLMPLALDNVTATVQQKKLEVRYPEGYLSIHPWPEFLPQQLSDQKIRAERQPWPAGPSDRVSFTRRTEQHPWLIIGSQSRSAALVVGDWNLQRIDANWYVTNGKQTILLAEKNENRAPIHIVACGERWRVYPLASKREKASSAAVTEREPRISWVAVRP